MTSETKRIVVVGGGVVGAAITCRIAEMGGRVTIVDEENSDSGASRGSLAWLNASSATDEQYATFRAASLRIWHEFATRPKCPAAFPGSFLFSQRFAEPERRAAWLSDLGWPAATLTTSEFADRQPGIAARPDRVLHVPGEGVADPRRITSWLLQQARERGAIEVRAHARVVETGVRLSDGTQLPADTVVVAAGAATGEMVAHLGATVSVGRRPGLAIRTVPVPALVSGYLEADSVHFWQDSDGSLLAGADFGSAEHVGNAERPTAEILRDIERLCARPTRLSVAEALVRSRPIPADGLPIVGHLAAAPNVYVAVMHSGMTLAPLIGKLVAEEVLNEHLQPLLSDYRPR